MREGISGLIPSFLSLFLTVTDSLHFASFCIFTLSLSFFYSLFFHSYLSVLLVLSISPSLSLLSPLSLSQSVMWLQLIAVEINKASKFVFLLYCVTQRKGDVF